MASPAWGVLQHGIQCIVGEIRFIKLNCDMHINGDIHEYWQIETFMIILNLPKWNWINQSTTYNGQWHVMVGPKHWQQSMYILIHVFLAPVHVFIDFKRSHSAVSDRTRSCISYVKFAVTLNMTTAKIYPWLIWNSHIYYMLLSHAIYIYREIYIYMCVCVYPQTNTTGEF